LITPEDFNVHQQHWFNSLRADLAGC
jgi:hypothetical protein